MTSKECREHISEHRSYLMGLAIIWIMIHHTFYFEMFDYGYFTFIAKIGSCGVDVFLFVSSFGLFYSFSKNSQLSRFFIRRALRILPTFVLVMTGVVLLFSPMLMLKLGYWYRAFHDNWYISFILIMYFCFPIFYYLQKKFMFLPFIVSVLLSAILTFFLIRIQRDNIHDVPMLMAQRLPIFACGMLFADNRFFYKVTVGFLIFVLLLTNVLLGVSYYTNAEYLVYPLFCILTVSLVLLFSKYSCRIFDGILKWIGSLSLELYLIHMAVIPCVLSFYKGLTGVFFVFLLSFVFSVLVQYATSYAMAPIYRYLDHELK